jgi:hypothetical protein
MRNIQAEIDNGRRFSGPGFIASFTIKEDMKRRSGLGIGSDLSPLDPDRTLELAIDNSLARSAEMARRYRNRASSPRVDSKTQSESQVFDSSHKITTDRSSAERIQLTCTQQICTWRAADSTTPQWRDIVCRTELSPTNCDEQEMTKQTSAKKTK